jgi:hypothetical protein
MKISELDATQVRSEPIRIDLDTFILNLGGKKVSLKGQWIDVLPSDSDEFHNSHLEMQRKATKGEPVDTNELVACLIVGWSFDEECTMSNKVVAVKTWPRPLINHIDKTASTAINFTMI